MEIQEHTSMVYINILNQKKNLAALNEDWASWDDTYEFIVDRNEEYIESNLISSTLTTLDLNLMAYVDCSGKLIYVKLVDHIYHRNFDTIQAIEVSVPEELYSHLKKGSPLASCDDSDDDVSGFLILSDRIMMVSSKPILTSNDKGPARGSLIMGRYMDYGDINEMSKMFFTSVDFLRLDNPGNQKEYGEKAAAIKNDGSSILIEELGADFIAGYKLIKDIYNEPVLLLQVKNKRDIYNQGIMTEIDSIVLVTGIISVLALITYLLISNTIVRRLANLSGRVKEIGEKHDLDQRINYSGRDELSILSKNINAMLDDLKLTHSDLRKSEERYRSLFENSLDGIYTSTLDGKYIDANQSLIDMLGYSNKAELLAINIPGQLYWNESERPSPEERNKIFETTLKGKNGQKIYVEISSRVIHDKDGNPYYQGVVRDITLRKRAEEKIKLLSFHDDLTGLYNRAYFEEELKRLDTERQLPLSVVIGDVNGLKLINDAFGHMQGDLLLCICANIFEECCRKDDIIARWGGDEFIILLPRTNEDDANKLVDRVKERCRQEKLNDIPISISLGVSTKTNTHEIISVIVKEAEDIMYRRKLLERKSISSSIILSLERTLWERSNEDEQHASRIRDLALKLGKLLRLSANNLDKLVLLATLHDLGKVAVPDKVLTKKTSLTKKEWEIIKRHPEIGYNIAQSSSQLMPIAEGILAHHEKWDGTGYPQGLKGKEIPLISRIIAIVDAYDVMTHNQPYRDAITEDQAAKELIRNSGTSFDPELIDAFLIVLENNK